MNPDGVLWERSDVAIFELRQPRYGIARDARNDVHLLQG